MKTDKQLTKEAKAIYKQLFGEPIERHWHFLWYCKGLAISPGHDTWMLAFAHGLDDKDDYDTLVHEFLHSRGLHRHTPKFYRLVKQLLKQVWPRKKR